MSVPVITALLILGKITVVLTVGLSAAHLARRSRAAVRHVLLAATFAVATALPVASMFVPAFSVAVPMPAPLAGAAPDVVVREDVATGRGDGARVQRQETSRSPVTVPTLSTWSWATIVWLAGVAFLMLPLIAGLRQMRSLRRSGIPCARGRDMAAAIAAEGMGAGLPDSASRSRIDVLLHESTPGPLTFGIMLPVILLPRDAETWPDDDLRRAIVHELEHVRRGDWLTQCLGRIVCTCYWFHPLVWMAWRRFVIEAERACDDAVLRRSEATAYADQLVELATRLSAASRQPLLAMASRRDLSTRVRAVLNPDQPRGQAGVSSIGLAVAASIALVLVLSPLRIVASSQTPAAGATTAKPRYDVASIKRCEVEPVPTGARGTAGGTNASVSPGRFQVPCVTAEQLIYLAYAAYGARDDQHLANDDMGSASNPEKVRGGPEWVHSLKEKYAIEATAAGATERVVLMGDMLQSLLEDRFKLKLHRETEPVDMLELKVKDSVKLTPMKDGDCVVHSGGDDWRPDPNATKPFCGSINMAGSATAMRWTFGGYTFSSLASMLSSNLKVHVIDSTGVKDKFVFRFEFQRDDAYSKSAEAQLEARDPNVPSLNAALEAIGLKLEKTKAPRGYLVIDSIERPTPNGPEADALPPARATGSGLPRRGLGGRGR